MKVRMDFVTNSSSSSFILARTSKLNEKQKEEILQYVEKTFLGNSILTPESFFGRTGRSASMKKEKKLSEKH